MAENLTQHLPSQEVPSISKGNNIIVLESMPRDPSTPVISTRRWMWGNGPEAYQLLQQRPTKRPTSRSSHEPRPVQDTSTFTAQNLIPDATIVPVESTFVPIVQEAKLTAERDIIVPEIGNQVGAYQLGREIARGMQGVVYVAYEKDNKVAIKLPYEKESIESLAHEAGQTKKFSSLPSPFLGTLIESGRIVPSDEQREIPYLVMEYAEKGSLASLLKDKHQFSYTKAALMVAQVADALAAMHDEDYGHFDVKPANILLLRDINDDTQEIEDLEVRLVDFGIADRFKEGFSLLPGTPAFLAPEQLSGSTEAKTDAFALGATYYELVTGSKLFNNEIIWNGDRADRDIRLEGEEKFNLYMQEKLKEIPEQLREPLAKVLSYDATTRTTAWDFASELNTAIIALDTEKR